MCGIVGYISKFDQAHKDAREKFLIEALVMDTLRGWDSTGITWLENTFDVNMMRACQPGSHFVRNKKFLNTDTNGWACIGHNRAATHGSVKVKNAHPFNHGAVTLVHNGTLSNWKSGLRHTNPKIEVDSDMIAYNLSMVAPEEANEILRLINGSYALAWYDQRDQTINFAKNSGRPLHFAESRNGSLVYFMSEADMLRAIAARQKDSSNRIDTIYGLENYKHLKFKKGCLVPEVSTVDPFVAPRVSRPSAPHSNVRSVRPKTSANARAEARWKAAQSGPKTSYLNTGGEVSVLSSDTKAWRGGKHLPLSKYMTKWAHDMYQLEPHMRVSFLPTEYVPWDEDRGMVRGTIRHPLWGYTDWEAVVYGFAKAWVSDDRMNTEWTVSPIGLAPAWYGKSSAVMPPLMVQVRQFEWDGPCSDEEEEQYKEIEENLATDFEDDIPFDTEDDKQTKLASPEDWLGDELFWGPNDKLIWREQLEGMLEYGCSGCQGNLTAEDHEDIMWVGMHGDQPLCYDCTNKFTDPDYETEEMVH